MSSELNTESSLSESPVVDEAPALTEDEKKQMAMQHQRAVARRNRFYGQDTKQVLNVEAKTDDARAYLERMQQNHNPPVMSANQRLDAILSRIQNSPIQLRTHELITDHALIIVNSIYEAELKKQGKRLMWQSDENRAIMQEVTKYFIGDPACAYSLNACLFLYGDTGTGKSFLLKEVMYLLTQIVPIECMKFYRVSAKLLVQDCADAKSLKPLDFYKTCGNLLIDDLGEEKAYVANYANTENPMDILLTARYEAFIRHGHKTHFTSNKQPGDEVISEPGKPDIHKAGELEKRYGTRIVDRLAEMCEAIYIPGVSYRSEFDPD